MQRKDLQGIQASKAVLQVSFEARHPERKGSKRISSDSGRGVELPKVGELSEEGSSDGDAGKDSVRRGHEPHGVGPEEGGGAEGEEAAHLCGGPGEGEAPDPEGGERHDELPDADGEEEGEEQEQPGHELVGEAKHELGEGQPDGSVCGVDGGDGDGALAHLKDIGLDWFIDRFIQPHHKQYRSEPKQKQKQQQHQAPKTPTIEAAIRRVM